MSYSSMPYFESSYISGNTAQSYGGGLSISESSVTLNNCVVSENISSGEIGDIIHISSNGELNISNSIISNNTGFAVSDFGMNSVSLINNCLFDGNSAGIYYKQSTGEQIADVTDLNLNVPAACNNISGDPMFAVPLQGVWTQEPVVDPDERYTVFTDDNADFEPGKLRRSIISLNTTQMKQYFIADNTETEIYILGNATDAASISDAYTLIDYHLSNGSVALDRANLTTIPETDMDGEVRPGDDDLADIGMDEVPSEYEPPEDTQLPISCIFNAPELVIGDSYSFSFCSSDTESGVSQILVYFRKDSGSWQAYPGQFSPADTTILFQTAQAEGQGYYEIYTIAEDNEGNIETPPAEPDAAVYFLSEFTFSIVYVDIDTAGYGNGESWEHATKRISIALEIAQYFSIGEIWVAEGTYLESLQIPELPLIMAGGFEGGESLLSQRNLAAHEVTIDAGTADEGYPADYVIDVTYSTPFTLDGFTLTGADYHGLDLRGDDGEFKIINCRIAGNNSYSSGAGVYCSYAAFVLSENCVFSDNTGNYVSSSIDEVMIFNCIFIRNQANNSGTISLYSNAQITNCLIADNEAEDYPGIYSSLNSNDSLSIINCTFTNNRFNNTSESGCIRPSGATEISASIFWNSEIPEIEYSGSNLILQYCDVEGGYQGVGVIDADPLFVIGPDGEYYISQIVSGQSADSPCLDSQYARANQVFYEGMNGDVYMSHLTTRTDLYADMGMVDIGFHYSNADVPAPSFTEYDNYLNLYPEFQPSATEVEVIGQFNWPEGAGSFNGAVFYAGLTDPEMTTLHGHFGSFMFGWGN